MAESIKYTTMAYDIMNIDLISIEDVVRSWSPQPGYVEWSANTSSTTKTSLNTEAEPL